ncbi:hypothetical protein FVA81_19710 [Rhizobium sp. WL3]|nr:hypothetical protein FVA81_19710 [Rhizobium sp. WL3]
MGWSVARLAIVALCVHGCGVSHERLPRSEGIFQRADVSQDEADAVDLQTSRRNRPYIVALSGGGPDGAFGAGYLSALESAGCLSPDIVTGVSIGALVGTLAFAYEREALRRLFAEGEAKRLVPSLSPIRAIFTGAVSSGEAYHTLVADFITTDVIAQVAEEHRRGRRLFVATTDFDAMRMRVWNMGLIARIPGPDAEDLFRNVLLASASIPGIYPPVRLPANPGSVRLHVDAGTTGQVFIPELPHGSIRPRLRIIFNNRIEGDPPLRLLSLLGTVQRGLSTLLRAQSRHQIDLARARSKQIGGTVEVAAIPAAEPVAKLQDFSQKGMAETFALGDRMARSDGC